MRYEDINIDKIIKILLAMLLVVIIAFAYANFKNLTNEMVIVREDNSEEIEARITKYGWTGNKMSNNEYPHIGAIATSDRSIELGTRVIIDGKEYIVKDRTALWVYEDFAHKTFDIYSEETEEEMLEFGAPIMKVKIHQ